MQLKLHSKRRKSAESSSTFQQVVLMAGLFAALALTLEAAQPSWWTSSGAVNGSATPDDELVANQGQLKQFTQKGTIYLNANLTNGAGPTLNSLVTGWSNFYQTNGYTAANPSTNDLQVIRQGQLKYVANLIYPRLMAEGLMTTNYPSWLQTNASDNKAANLGELKQIFAFQAAVPQAPVNPSNVANDTQTIVSWHSDVLTVQTFTIQGSVDGGETWTTMKTVNGNLNSATITGLDPAITYQFRVVASNALGSSGPSTVTSRASTTSGISASIVTPSPNSTNLVGSTLPFSISVDSPPGVIIQQVKFYVDSAYTGLATVNPYYGNQYSAPVVLPTVGPHQLKAFIMNSLGGSCEVSVVTTAVPYDIDNDGLSDDWELAHFQSLAEGPTGNPDGDTFNNLQEYTNGTDPTDYYNGQTVTPSIVQGNNQTGWLGRYLDEALQVKVMKGSVLQTNAPVQFRVTNGDGLLATRLDKPQADTLTVLTDTNGIATVYYYQTDALTNIATVQASANTPSPMLNFSVLVPDINATAPITPGGLPPGTQPPPAPPLADNVVELRGETISVTHHKVGYATYVPTNPSQIYLTENRWDQQSFSNPDESGILPGSDVTTWDPQTETTRYLDYTYPIVPNMGAYGAVTTQTAVSSFSTGIYHEHPDCYSKNLSNPYTTDMLKELVISDLAKKTFTGAYSSASTSASYNLSEEEATLQIINLRHEFFSKSTIQVNLHYLVVFQPSSANVDRKIYFKNHEWPGQVNMAPSHDLLPDKEEFENGNPVDRRGDYYVVPYPFELRSDADIFKGWDSTTIKGCLTMQKGATSSLLKLVLPGDWLSKNPGLELAVASGSIVSLTGTTTITDPETTFNVVAGSTTGSATINLQVKATGQIISSFDVRVLSPKIVTVEIYSVTDSNNSDPQNSSSTALPANAITPTQILNALNAIYGPQAGITFSLNNSDTTANIHYDGNTNGIVDNATEGGLSIFPQPSPGPLKIYIVKKIKRPEDIDPDVTKGLTLVGVGRCLVAATASVEAAAHEVGHALFLSTKEGRHDDFPWPVEFVSDGLNRYQTGLMYATTDFQTPWIRKDDIVKANASTSNFHP